MRRSYIAAVFLIPCLSAGTAAAPQPITPGPGAQGVLRLGASDTNTSAKVFLSGDLDLSFGYDDWAVTLGGFGAVGRLHETYFDLRYATSQGSVIIGFPRPAYDLVAPSALSVTAKPDGLDSVGVSRSRATFGTMNQPDYLPYGAVFLHQTDGVTGAVSLHKVPSYATWITGFAAAYQAGPARYAAAVEAVAQNNDLAWNWKARLDHDTDWGAWSVAAFDAAANGADPTIEWAAQVAVGPTALVQIVAQSDLVDSWLLRAGASVDLTAAVSLTGSIGHGTDRDEAALALAWRF